MIRIESKKKVEEATNVMKVKDNKVIDIIASAISRKSKISDLDYYSVDSYDEDSDTSGSILTHSSFFMQAIFDLKITFYGNSKEEIGICDCNLSLKTEYLSNKGAKTTYTLGGAFKDFLTKRSITFTDTGAY